MQQTNTQPGNPALLCRLETLFDVLVLASWNNPDSLDIHDAKVLSSSMVANERISFDLMQLIVWHLDAARVLFPDANKLYDVAWELFIDIPIPFTAVVPPPSTFSDEAEERDYAFYHGFNLEDLE